MTFRPTLYNIKNTAECMDSYENMQAFITAAEVDNFTSISSATSVYSTAMIDWLVQSTARGDRAIWIIETYA